MEPPRHPLDIASHISIRTSDHEHHTNKPDFLLHGSWNPFVLCTSQTVKDMVRGEKNYSMRVLGVDVVLDVLADGDGVMRMHVSVHSINHSLADHQILGVGVLLIYIALYDGGMLITRHI
jgi:hypothetical protein